MMPRSSQPNPYSSSDKRTDRKSDTRSYRYYDDDDDDDCEDDRSKGRRNLGRTRHPDDERKQRSHSRSRSPKRNEINSKSDDSRITAGIQMKLAVPAVNPLPAASKTSLPNSSLPSKPSTSKLKVASIFDDDDDDEPEEMPPECRMRMKNVGRETPTSAGPNSFGKTKIGFCNVSHIAEKKHNK